MLNKTSSFYKEKKIDFKVMGLDDFTSDFLNWCMKNRNNLEFLKDKNVLELKSSSANLYFDDLNVICRVDKLSTDRRT